MMEIIIYKNEAYPKFQTEGFAAKFAFPFAKEVLKFGQIGFDIGCNREEWKLPGAIAIDPLFTEYDAMNLPKDIQPHYIFSSHMLEHYKGSWVEVLNYWHSVLPSDGILFLYLPHYSQKYWRSWNNTKHIHNLSPELLRDYFTDGDHRKGFWKNIFVTEGYDLNNSFYAIATKN